MSSFSDSLKKKTPVADKLFLHCCARFVNCHIHVHFRDAQWSRTDSEEYVDIELACIAKNCFVFLQRTVPQLSTAIPCATDICEQVENVSHT